MIKKKRKIIQFQNKLIKLILDLIYKNRKKDEWYMGTIDTVVSIYKAYVYINGSSSSQLIPTNPDVIFNPGDEVFVHFINGDSTIKYIPYKRSIEPI
jgi:predicted Holliday junction resolvase-like endonuclease